MGLQIVIPMAVLTLLGGVYAISEIISHDNDQRGIYDSKVELGAPVFRYDSDRSFNGDGYSFSVYDLPATVRTRFESVDDRLLTAFPKRSSYRKDWKVECWREAPFDEKFKGQLEFALSSYDSDKASGLSEHFVAIRKALGRKGTYYAFLYHSPTGYIANVDLFVVDLIDGRLYRINHNT